MTEKTLQELLIEKINDITDIDLLCDELSRCSKKVVKEDRIYFENTSNFFRSLYGEKTIDVLGLTLEFPEVTQKTKEVLADYGTQIGCDQSKVAAEIIAYKQSIVKGVKHINGRKKSS